MLILLVALVGSVYCHSPSEPRASQRYLFEVELENHDPRFPVYWLGLVIDADGSVLAYDRGTTPTFPCSHWWQWVSSDECTGLVTELQLDGRYPDTRPLATLPPEEVAERRRQARQLASGPWRVPNLSCNDYGVLGLVAFSFDPTTGLYRPIVLRLEGDQMRQNLSPSAEELSSWLLAVAEALPRVREWRSGARECRPD